MTEFIKFGSRGKLKTENYIMKILLVFPPLAYMMSPYLSLPSLVAYMRKNGYVETCQRDLNIEFLDEILTPEKLEKNYDRVFSSWKELDKKRCLLPEEQSDYINLSSRLAAFPYLIRNILKAKKIARGQEGKPDFISYRNSLDLIKKGIDFFFTGYEDFRGNSSFEKDRFIELIMSPRNPFTGIFKEQFLPSIIDASPSLVGIAISFFDQLIPAFTLASLIRKTCESVHITAGGSMVTILKDKIPEIPHFLDFFHSFIPDEGEISLLELACSMEEGRGLREIPGLIYKRDDNIVSNSRDISINIKDIPPPSFEGFPLEEYFSPGLYLPLTATRGCSWNKCSFCAFSEAFNRKFRCKDKELLAEDIKELIEKYNTSFFEFHDNALPVKTLISSLELLEEEGVKISWSGQAIPTEIFTEETCQKLHRLGCKLLMFGMETGCERVLSLMNKNFKVSHLKEALWNSHRAGISVLVFVIIGFPGETGEEAEFTFKFLEDNREAIDAVCLHPFILASGSYAGCNPEKYGIVKLPAGDITASFPYETRQGLSEKEAWEIVFDSGYNNDVFYPYFVFERTGEEFVESKFTCLSEKEFFRLFRKVIYLDDDVSFLEVNFHWKKWTDVDSVIKYGCLKFLRGFPCDITLKYMAPAWLLYNGRTGLYYTIEKSAGDKILSACREETLLIELVKDVLNKEEEVLLIKDLIERRFLKV